MKRWQLNLNKSIMALALLSVAVPALSQVRNVKYVEQEKSDRFIPVDTITEYRSNSLRYSLSTNLADWCNLGTLSAEGSISLVRHFTFNVGARYNPWSIGADDSPQAMQNRRRTFYAGPRIWPWNVYSGAWVALHAQYEEYNRGGLFKDPTTEEGDAFGVSLGIGFSRMLHKNWNIEVGAYGWGGKAYYTEYEKPRCGKCVLDYGTKAFIRYDRVAVSFVYIFNTK